MNHNFCNCKKKISWALLQGKMATPLCLPYRFLGSSGLKVSTLCLGTMTFGEKEGGRPGQCDQSAAEALLDRFVEAGGNFIDTADVYQNGESEIIIGKWLSKNPSLRKKLVLATKVWGPMDSTDVNCRALSRRHIMEAINDSLQRLQTTYIDLYQTHCWDDGTPVEETLRALRDLQACGKIHYVGVSNVTGWQFQKMVDTAKEVGLTGIVSNQAQYNLLCRSTEWELLEVCKREGVAMLPWSPLKGGLLTGKFKRGETPDPASSRVGWTAANKDKRSNQSHPSFEHYANNDQFWGLLDSMHAIAAESGGSVAQVALAWLLKQPMVASVVIGARTMKQLEDNINGAFLTLSDAQIAILNDKSKDTLPYPYEMVFRLQAGRKRD